MARQFTVESRYISHLLQGLSASNDRGLTGVAEELASVARMNKLESVSRPFLSLVRDQQNNAGAKLEALMAAKYYAGSIDDLKRAAREWAAQQGLDDVAPAARPTDRYPSRAMAARWAREAGISAAAIKIVCDMVLEGPDPGARFWLDLMDSQNRAGDSPMGQELQRQRRKR